MLWRINLNSLALLLALTIITLCSTGLAVGQNDVLGDGGADPVKLFELAQNAHARGDLARALTFYEEALKVRPEFPEAEFQRGNVLVSMGRLADAESAFQSAIKLRSDWYLPYSALGALLARVDRNREAESTLRQSLKLNSKDYVALRLLAGLRLQAGDATEAVKLAQTATSTPEAPAAAWLVRAMAERAKGDNARALLSLDQGLQIQPDYAAALIERAELRVEAGDRAQALEDLKALEPTKSSDKSLSSRVAVAYERLGLPEDARRVAESAGLVKETKDAAGGKNQVTGTPAEIEAANSEDGATSRAALLKLLEKNPGNAMLLARLGASYRTDDPVRSLEFYRQAVEAQPDNADYATGYASALIRARHFSQAAAILRRVIAVFPDHYVAHANLATALYELKRYPEAIPEYQWLLKAKPDLAVAHYFIGTAHDYLGEYNEALAAYEAFLRMADAKTNQLEIDKVNLRLPSLRRQIELRQGVKRKP